MADKRISQLVDRGTVVNNDVIPIVVSGATTTNKATISSIQTFMQGNLDLGVTSVGITFGTSGTDINASGSPVTSSGNITINLPTASAVNRGALSSADWSTFNGKQPAGNYVTLDTTQTITAQKTFTTSGGSDSVIITTTGGGFALDAIKAGNGEVIRVNKTSGTGNAMTVIGGNFEAPTIVKTGGTSSQFLKADGSVDSTAYTTNTGTVTSVSGTGTVSGLSLSGTVTTSGNLTLGGTLSLTSANVTDGLGFTPYNATNPAGYTTNVGTVTSVAATAGTGISISGSPITTSGTLTITNTAPDQTVALTAGTGISTSGTYPNFTITNTSPSSGGTVTSVAAITLGTTGTDLSSTVATGTTTPVITLQVPTASAANRGALSSTDWSTFNSKQSTITLTTTGTSGAATFSANTLNIPNYADGGVLSLSAIGGTANANGATITGTVLNLQPADASFGGVVTTGTQTFAGAKTLTGALNGTSASFSLGSSAVPTAANSAFYPSASTSTTAYAGTYYDGSTAYASFLGRVPSSLSSINDGLGYVTISGSTPTLRVLFSNSEFKLNVPLNGTSASFTGNVSASGTGNIVIQAASSNNFPLFQLLDSRVGGNTWNIEGGRTLANLQFRSSIAGGTVLELASTGAATFASSVQGSRFFSVGSLNDTNGSFLIDHPTVQTWKIGITNANTSTFSIGNDNGGAFAAKYFNITNAGNVGIGTASPSALLQLQGSGDQYIKITSTNNNNAGVRFNSIGGNEFSIFSDTSLRFYDFTAAAERMRITSGGNVLVGTTTNNGEKLNVNGSLKWGSTTNYISSGNDGGGMYAELIGTTTATRQLRIQGINDAGTSYSSIRLEAGASQILFVTADTERMRITSAGNVGIGTTSPTALLNTFSSSTSTQIIVTGADTTNQRLEVTDGTVTNRFGIFGRTNGDAGVIGTQTNHPLLINTNNTEQMRITSGGNVLIKTTTDTSHPLRVNGRTFTNELVTLAPESESISSAEWRFGTASIASITPNRRLRVKVGGVEYYIGAVEV